MANLLLIKPSLRTTQAHQAVAPFVLATNLGLLRRGGAAGVAPEGPSSLQLTEGICIAKGFTIEHGESRWSEYSHLIYMQLGLELTSEEQIPEEVGISPPHPTPRHGRGLRELGLCTAETTFLQQGSSGGVKGRTLTAPSFGLRGEAVRALVWSRSLRKGGKGHK